MKKIKHSKYKNVSFLSEIIVKRITELEFKLQTENLSTYLSTKYDREIERLNHLYNNYFKNKKMEIYKEFRIHKQVLENKRSDMTGKIIEKARSLYNEKVDKNKLNKELYKVVKELRLITSKFDSIIKETVVDNYKTYASVYKSLRYDLNYDLSEAVESEETISNFINEQNERKFEKEELSKISKPAKIAKIYNLKEDIIKEVKDFDQYQKNIIIGYVTKDKKLFNKGIYFMKESLNNFNGKEEIKEIIENLNVIKQNPKIITKHYDYVCLANDILVDLENENDI